MPAPSGIDRTLGKMSVGGTTKRVGPLWKGPTEDGITFSLLSRYLADKERFRILTVEGLRARDDFQHRMEFGNMWHVCEEFHAKAEPGRNQWAECLATYVKLMFAKYPMKREEIGTCYEIVRTMFPVYVDFWSKHPDMENREPILSEQVFDVRYRLPSGRDVRLRGKWDSVDAVTERKKSYIWLQENKTKSDVDPNKIVRQLSFDLQTMMYLVALTTEQDNSFWRRANKRWRDIPVRGVRYNVIRRPRQYQGKKETAAAFYARLRGIVEDDPVDFFHRWNVEVTKAEIDRFRRECLDPALENLLDDYQWWDGCKVSGLDVFDSEQRAKLAPWHLPRHLRMPFGVYNPLMEGGSTDLDEYLLSGSTAGLSKVDTLFRELT